MKRLVDHDIDREPDPVLAEAARLVRSASFVEPGLQQRIRAALAERDRPRWVWRLRPVVAVALLVALVTIAGATAVRGLLKQASSVPARDDQRETVVPPKKLSKLQTNNTPAQPVVASPVAASPAVAAQPKPSLTRVEPVDDSARPSRRNDRPESVLVVGATHALRHEHDPARALKLLEEYLRRYPRGALVEETLALAIEAASTLGDPKAASYARQYLERYPTGRFREQARRAQLRAAP